MKLHKLLTPFVCTLGLTSTVFSLVGCTEQPDPEPTPWTEETPYEYIHNRSFSIEEITDSYVYWGTGWIIDDSTPQNQNDYCYYIATNWHVTHAFQTGAIGSSRVEYRYADDSLTSGQSWVSWENYLPFVSFSYLKESNYFYNDKQQDYFKKGIDLYVCEVNFGTPTGNILSKLNFLNELRASKGKINKFVKADDNQIRRKRKIVGGYPVHETYNSSGGQWEFHDDITSGKTTYIQKSKTTFLYTADGEIQYGHAIGCPDLQQNGIDPVPAGYWYPETPEQWYVYDISPQYEFTSSVYPTWMDGGSSGSMLITEDCEVCGIYWGGWGDGYGGTIPCFSLFKTSNFDFTQQWLKK